jgi:phosphoribosylaminoimidazole carboxylase
MTRAYRTAGASVHWYCKQAVEPRRKIGHVNIVGPTRTEARRRLESVEPGAAAALGGVEGMAAEVAIIMGSDSDLPTMALAAQVTPCFVLYVMSMCVTKMPVKMQAILF